MKSHYVSFWFISYLKKNDNNNSEYNDMMIKFVFLLLNAASYSVRLYKIQSTINANKNQGSFYRRLHLLFDSLI